MQKDTVQVLVSLGIRSITVLSISVFIPPASLAYYTNRLLHKVTSYVRVDQICSCLGIWHCIAGTDVWNAISVFSYLSKWIGCVPDISLVSKDNKTTTLLEATHKVTWQRKMYLIILNNTSQWSLTSFGSVVIRDELELMFLHTTI